MGRGDFCSPGFSRFRSAADQCVVRRARSYPAAHEWGAGHAQDASAKKTGPVQKLYTLFIIVALLLPKDLASKLIARLPVIISILSSPSPKGDLHGAEVRVIRRVLDGRHERPPALEPFRPVSPAKKLGGRCRRLSEISSRVRGASECLEPLPPLAPASTPSSPPLAMRWHVLPQIMRKRGASPYQRMVMSNDYITICKYQLFFFFDLTFVTSPHIEPHINDNAPRLWISKNLN